jgi:hypothetical protein
MQPTVIRTRRSVLPGRRTAVTRDCAQTPAASYIDSCCIYLDKRIYCDISFKVTTVTDWLILLVACKPFVDSTYVQYTCIGGNKLNGWESENTSNTFRPQQTAQEAGHRQWSLWGTNCTSICICICVCIYIYIYNLDENHKNHAIDRKHFYSKTNKMHNTSNLFYLLYAQS